MDRVAVVLALVGVLAGAVGGYRAQTVFDARERAEAVERRVAQAEAEVARIRRVTADARPMAPAALSLKAFAAAAAAEGEALNVRVVLEPAKSAAWAPLRAEGVHVVLDTAPSVIAARDWLAQAVDRYPLFLTKLIWDGRAGHVHGAIVGQ